MAFAEHEVLIPRDAMDVYTFLIDGMNLPQWRTGIRSISLASGAAGPRAPCTGRRCWAGPAGPVPADFEITEARPGAEIRFQVIAGPDTALRRVLPQHRTGQEPGCGSRSTTSPKDSSA